MLEKSIVIATLIVALTIILMFNKHAEGFANKRDKAKAIWSWFNLTPRPTYEAYRTALGHKSNIVEYDDAVRLFRGRDRPTIDDVEELL